MRGASAPAGKIPRGRAGNGGFDRMHRLAPLARPTREADASLAVRPDFPLRLLACGWGVALPVSAQPALPG